MPRQMTPAERHHAAERRVRRVARDVPGPTVQIHKPAMEPKTAPVMRAPVKAARSSMNWRTKAGIFAGTATAATGATYLYRHHKSRQRDGMNIVKRDAGGPVELKLHEYTPEERRKRANNYTAGGAAYGAVVGGLSGAGIEDASHYGTKMKWKKGTAIGAAIGTPVMAAAFRHGANKQRYRLETGQGRRLSQENTNFATFGKSLGRQTVSKFYDPFNDEIVEFSKAAPGQKSHYADAVSNVSTKYALMPTGASNRAPGLKLLKVHGKHTGSLPRRTALTHIHH